MAHMREFEIRLLKSGKVFQFVPAIADSEASARTKASMLCSQLGADGFEVFANRTAHRSEPNAAGVFGLNRNRREQFSNDEDPGVASIPQ